jgi:hypothetical protein
MTDDVANDTRRGSRLELDDKYHCKYCGAALPTLMVDGPIAGGETEYAPVELCGRCTAKQYNRRAGT